MKHTTDEPIPFGNVGITINPGSGDIKGGNEKNAIDNTIHFIADLKIDHIKFIRVPEEDDGGRFAFLLWIYDRGSILAHLVLMPGLFLEDVRYVRKENQNIWDFPRIYVDGSSGVWLFSLDACFSELRNKEI